MEALYNWVRNLTCYLIFVTVVINLLPDKKYEKYLRFFFGMVFLLLVIQPFTRGFRIEEKISYYFASLSLQNEAADLQKELLGAESVRLEQLFGRYEEAVAEDISQLAQTGGFYVLQAEVKLGRDTDSQDYGRVTRIRLVLMTEAAKLPAVEPVAPVVTVEPVAVGETQAQPPASEGQKKDEENAAVRALKKQLLNYYDLEENDVEIQVQNEQG